MTNQQRADQALLASLGNVESVKSATIGMYRWDATVNGTAPEFRVILREESQPVHVPWITRVEMREIVLLARAHGAFIDDRLVAASLGTTDLGVPGPPSPPLERPPQPRKREPDPGDVLPRPVYPTYRSIPPVCPRCGSPGSSPIWFSFTGMTSTGRQANCFICRHFTFTVTQTTPNG